MSRRCNHFERIHHRRVIVLADEENVAELRVAAQHGGGGDGRVIIGRQHPREVAALWRPARLSIAGGAALGLSMLDTTWTRLTLPLVSVHPGPHAVIAQGRVGIRQQPGEECDIPLCRPSPLSAPPSRIWRKPRRLCAKHSKAGVGSLVQPAMSMTGIPRALRRL